jgi:hypothetical protein
VAIGSALSRLSPLDGMRLMVDGDGCHVAINSGTSWRLGRWDGQGCAMPFMAVGRAVTTWPCTLLLLLRDAIAMAMAAVPLLRVTAFMVAAAVLMMRPAMGPAVRPAVVRPAVAVAAVVVVGIMRCLMQPLGSGFLHPRRLAAVSTCEHLAVARPRRRTSVGCAFVAGHPVTGRRGVPPGADVARRCSARCQRITRPRAMSILVGRPACHPRRAVLAGWRQPQRSPVGGICRRITCVNPRPQHQLQQRLRRSQGRALTALAAAIVSR